MSPFDATPGIAVNALQTFLRPAPREIASGQVRSIIEFRDGMFDPLFRRQADMRLAIDHA